MKVQAEWKVQIKNTSFLLFVNEIVNCTKFVVLGMQSFQLRLKFWKTKLISYQRQFFYPTVITNDIVLTLSPFLSRLFVPFVLFKALL